MSLGRSSSASRPVGAWYADHGTQVSMAVAQSQSQLEAIMPEVIIGTDDRVEVHDTLHYPYGCLCSLEITAANHRAFVGTGWLIDPQTVITAGHCVYMARQGGWARGISVFPGRNGDQKPKQARASRLFSVLGWTRDTAPRHDYGCIRLSEPIDDVGTFGYSALADTDLAEYRCHVVGYPGDKPFTMWGHVRRLREVRPRTLVYEIDTYGGNSGAPVFVVENQQVFAVGIHNYGDLSGNLATRITDEVFTNLDGWKT